MRDCVCEQAGRKGLGWLFMGGLRGVGKSASGGVGGGGMAARYTEPTREQWYGEYRAKGISPLKPWSMCTDQNVPLGEIKNGPLSNFRGTAYADWVLGL